MGAWHLYRYRNLDGSSKDWAIKANPDGSISTRWGKTAARLPGFNTRKGIRQVDIERQKRAKGYDFVSEVDIDSNGQLYFASHSRLRPPVGGLYWTLVCTSASRDKATLLVEINRAKNTLDALDEANTFISEYSGRFWQPLIKQLSDEVNLNGRFRISSQFKQADGILPCLILLSLKSKAISGVGIALATDNNRELTVDLRAEQDVLDFFGTDLESIKPVAEALGLLKSKLNLIELISDTEDAWF